MNRIIAALANAPYGNKTALVKKLKNSKFSRVELAPAFLNVFNENKENAQKLASVYATTLSTTIEHRELFQRVAAMDEEKQRVLIRGYRDAGQARGVVHAISQLPRKQASTMMRSFLIKEDGKKDKEAL